MKLMMYSIMTHGGTPCTLGDSNLATNNIKVQKYIVLSANMTMVSFEFQI